MDTAKIVADLSLTEYIRHVQTLGKNIRERREALRWSQKRLGEEAGGINVETVNRIEHDQNTTIEKLYAIAKALGISLGELLPEDQCKPAPAASCELCSNHRDLHQAVEDAIRLGVPTKSLEEAMRALVNVVLSINPAPEEVSFQRKKPGGSERHTA